MERSSLNAGHTRSSENRREGDADSGFGEGDRRHSVVRVNGQEAGKKGRPEGGVWSKCANSCKASSTA